MNKYERQIVLDEFGIPGQRKLAKARILAAGAGGLGCQALQYLTAAGVGTIGIADFDIIDLTNLHRQVLYTSEDIGKPKCSVAANRLRLMNPDAVIKEYPFALTKHNALELISEFDLVIDGTDNFSSKFMINDACVLLSKPLVYGAVRKFEGQIGVFVNSAVDSGRRTNLRDLFPKPANGHNLRSCSEEGVLGVLPGLIGTLQAIEAVKLITGIGKILENTLLTYNALNNSFDEFRISHNEACSALMPKDAEAFRAFDYGHSV